MNRTKPQLIASFVDTLRRLLSATAKHCGKNPEVMRAVGRAREAIQIWPEKATEAVGALLFRYSAQVFELEQPGGERFFLTESFTAELAAAGDADTARAVLLAVRDALGRLEGDELKHVTTQVVALLDIYLEYLEH
jgi:hypothetical protein